MDHARSYLPACQPDDAHQLYDQAEAERVAGNVEAAKELGYRAAAAARASEDLTTCSKALVLVSKVYLNAGDTKSAYRVSGEAVDAARKAGDERLLCSTLCTRVGVNKQLGLLEDALSEMDEAMEIATRLQDEELLYWCYNRAAILQGDLANFATADSMMQRSLAYSSSLGDEEKFCILNNLTDNLSVWEDTLAENGQHISRTEIERALDYGQRALIYALKAANPYREALILCNLGFVLGLLGRFDEAFSQLLRSQTIAATREYRALEASAYHYRAKVLMLMGKPEEAIAELAHALRLAEQCAEDLTCRDVCRSLAAACEQTGDTAAALKHYRAYHLFDRKIASAQASLKASLMVDRVELMNARLEAEKAEARQRELKDHSVMLEQSIRSLAAIANHADRKARTDALTGLYNRHSLDGEFEQRLRMAERGDESFVAVLMDVDHFKQVNDQYGHAIGDKVLKAMADVLLANLREGDVAVRYGGEEFLLLLAGEDLSKAWSACERLRGMIENNAWEPIAPGLHPTASFGLAAYRKGDSAEAMIKRADVALYSAKNAGRNRVIAG